MIEDEFVFVVLIFGIISRVTVLVYFNDDSGFIVYHETHIEFHGIIVLRDDLVYGVVHVVLFFEDIRISSPVKKNRDHLFSKMIEDFIDDIVLVIVGTHTRRACPAYVCAVLETQVACVTGRTPDVVVGLTFDTEPGYILPERIHPQFVPRNTSGQVSPQGPLFYVVHVCILAPFNQMGATNHGVCSLSLFAPIVYKLDERLFLRLILYQRVVLMQECIEIHA